MQIGILFPQTEIGDSPQGLRDYARAVVDAGFSHIVSYEHVLGAIPERLPEDYAPYGIHDRFHEVFTLYSFLSGVAPELGFATGILVLPQRQTALVAKQAAQIALLSGGKFRLGVGIGWNRAEFEALGADFSHRGRRVEEQITLLRKLWSEPVVNFQGEFETVEGCGILPLPERPIPIWIGGAAEPALRRASRQADGIFPLRPLEGGWKSTFARLREWRAEAGKSWESFGIEARVTIQDGWQNEIETWRELGATHIYLANMGRGLVGAQEHVRAVGELGRALQSLG